MKTEHRAKPAATLALVVIAGLAVLTLAGLARAEEHSKALAVKRSDGESLKQLSAELLDSRAQLEVDLAHPLSPTDQEFCRVAATIATLPVEILEPQLWSIWSTGQKATVDRLEALMGESIADVNSLRPLLDSAVAGIATGGEKDLHDVVLSVEMESLAFDLAVQIRNRLVEAYSEVFRMQV